MHLGERMHKDRVWTHVTVRNQVSAPKVDLCIWLVKLSRNFKYEVIKTPV